MAVVRALLPAFFGIVLSPVLLAVPALADDGLALLQRIAQGSRQLTYSGTFVYRSGGKVDSSRIAHSANNGLEVERIEALDGSPREVLRAGTEVKCFFPEEKLLIIENRSSKRGFPTLLPAGLGGLPEHYAIRSGGLGRVAGMKSRAVLLEPRDELRYGHEFWMDDASGLLLKASLLGERGETLESFAFTQVKIGGPLEQGALKPRFDSERVRVQQVRATEVNPEEMGWGFRAALPGFRKVAAMKRQTAPGNPESLHVVFSDGLASISVFIEPGGSAGEADTMSTVGPVNVYRRHLGEHRLVVMGEVPALAVRRLGDGIERRRK
ncbi:MucB/RseB C-terminal domain-containing protein [Sulfuritalea hydrogenivorans]|jgi:sigma-E factor negative regulatory protein RseB|uniref:Sigma factor regulatory protein n=1 Tax=Sulfuritalea hydrogenivorans sk43H TaxID=1223802 RepID=W0SJ28_9PROT|nr:MucB/RseB C-terminal domain-containing protein [Sulfuritalea hydrogenivorans]MDK9712694.1 MucB/RseB C-terminal domain-containing protein [Sulfuritalea sp.]BAO29983.1 sigma factor regulatory protein [Sulfuritalea hydrogenivorans sk43H]